MQASVNSLTNFIHFLRYSIEKFTLSDVFSNLLLGNWSTSSKHFKKHAVDNSYCIDEKDSKENEHFEEDTIETL